MTKKSLKKRYWKATKPSTTSNDLSANWWGWEDRETNYDFEAADVQKMSNDIPMSQMDELIEVRGF